jgi:hypothetical protein
MIASISAARSGGLSCRDGSLVPDPIAQAAIATMREARAAGHSLRHCAEMVRERHGLGVSHMTVKRVLEADRSPWHIPVARSNRTVAQSNKSYKNNGLVLFKAVRFRHVDEP